MGAFSVFGDTKFVDYSKGIILQPVENGNLSAWTSEEKQF